MIKAKDIKGVYTALITPFTDGKINEVKFRKFINWQIGQGVNGLVPCGTTGESPTLNADEHKKVTEICVSEVKNRVPVIAGTGSNSTAEAIEYTHHAEIAGADAVLIVAPYYNKPSAEGIFLHFKAIHDATNIPIIIYNIAGRSAIDISDETIANLAKLPRIIGLKDASGNLSRTSSLRLKLKENNIADFCLLSGDDITAVAFNAQGGQGCISVTANIAPAKCAAVQDATMKGNFAEALHLHEELIPLHQTMFVESNPIPVKYAAYLMGNCSDEIRLPLTQPTDINKQILRDIINKI